MNTVIKVRTDSDSFFSLRQLGHGLFLLIYLGLSFSLEAQIKKYPANISPVIGRPYSLFLTDYSTPGSNHLSANIVFNDFNEAQWNFRLRIKLESSQVRLETTADFRPSAPITLAPGVAKSLSGVDWEEYLNYNNLNISGVSVSDLIATGGRLPEGFYSFCFQVLDYDTGDPLSEEMCQTAWLKLMDPPRINLPLCGNNLDSKQTQHVFSWQLFDTVSPNATQGTNFQLTIWEVTEGGSNIQTAVANGQALQIFQTQELSQANYLYSLGDPPLELGKQYIYRVQAIDPEGRDKFKNQGYSEYCTFFYGWPTGGHIALQFPLQGGGFKKKDIPYVKWSAVDKLLTGQPVSYEIKVAPIDAGQTKEQAIENNSPWYYDNTPPASIHYDRSQQMDKQLKVMTQYAWQVKAFTDQQEVGKSDISYFNGPSLMENFWAGVHRVAVDYIDGINLNDISGEGRIRLTPESEAWIPVKFNHIQLHDEGDFYVMTGGEFFYQPPAIVSVELKADVEKNGKAFFDVSRYRVNKEGIYVEGNVRWPFPFATLSSTIANVKSDKQWANYNNFTVNTAARIAEGNQFKLLEPLQFTLSLSKTGIIYIYNNEYRFELYGTVDLPEKIKGTLPGIVQFPFRRADQLFYVEQDSIGGNSIISPLAKSNVQLVTRKYLLDLSEEQSPEKLNADARWKGIYIKDFDLGLNPLLDGNGQIDVNEKINTNLLTTVDTPTEAWISASGLNLKMDIAYPDSSVLKFQTFPSSVRRFRLEVQESQIVSSNSFLKGDFIIPVISNEKRFQYTVPATNVGFQDGYLENLIDTKFTFNAGGGDQEIKVEVKRAVLSAYEKISMTINLEWPSMGVTLTDLRGFNAWGDYTVGFDNRNGTVPLTQRHNASLSGYPVTIAVIGAASNDGNYILATTADAGLGDDVSGGEGVPSINVYSMVKNKYVPADASGQVGVNTTKQIPFAQASASATKSFTDLESELSQKVEANQEQLLSDAEALKNEVSASTANVYSPEDMVGSDSTPLSPESGTENPSGGKFNSRQQEIIYEIASGFVEEIAKPITGPVKRMTDSLNNVIARKVNALVDSISKVVVIKVDAIIVPFANNLAEKLRNDKINVVDPIKAMGHETSRIISDEITSALHTTAKENILTPIKTLLIDKVNGRINKHINVNGTRIVYSALIGNGGNAEDALKQLVDGVPAVLDSILLDVAAFVSMENIKSTISATASGFIQNISLSDVGHDLRKTGEDLLKDMVNDKVNQVVSGLAQKYADDLGLGGFGIGGENPIDFVGVAKRFSTGNIKDAFAIDPVRVQLKTPVIDLDGFMSYTPKHPVYGDVWLGDIDMTIKVPKKFAFNAIYFNGRKDSISYWFCQITPPEDGGNTAYELGKPLSKKPKALKDPVNIGIAQIVGASGRLYHHMIETPGNGIVPNAEMNYGAYMHFVFFDKGNNGKNLRLEVSGEINSKENGDYTIEFLGNLQTQSVKPEIFDIDKLAVVQGTVEVRYNSAEEHFFGYAKVVVNSPGKLCGQASLLVDVKPGKWRIAIGSREERVVFTPGCAGWAPTGWIDLNESTAELGLGVQYSGKATSGFDAKLISVDLTVDAGFAFGILAVVQYKPTFDLMKAGVWVDIWANVDATYKFAWGKSHTINLVQIYIRGDLVVIFNPPPTTLEGNLDGKVKVLSFNINFNAHMKKQI